MRYILLACLSITLIFFACSKKTTPSATRANMLRNGKWKLSSGTLTMKLPSGKDTVLNYLYFVPKCHQDDYINFGASNYGSVFSGASKCAPNDPDSVVFQWGLTNNDNNLSLYRGFNLIWSVKQTILPYHFDTLQQIPYLVLDTLVSVEDTIGHPEKGPIRLDSTWNLQFVGDSVLNLDIYNSTLSDFSQNSFTMNFFTLMTYPDSTGNHTGQYITTDPITSLPDTMDFDPIIRPDTFYYKLTFTNF